MSSKCLSAVKASDTPSSFIKTKKVFFIFPASRIGIYHAHPPDTSAPPLQAPAAERSFSAIESLKGLSSFALYSVNSRSIAFLCAFAPLREHAFFNHCL